MEHTKEDTTGHTTEHTKLSVDLDYAKACLTLSDAEMGQLAKAIIRAAAGETPNLGGVLGALIPYLLDGLDSIV